MGMTLKRAIKILNYVVYDYWLHESDEHGYSNLPTAEDEREACKVALDFIEGYEQRLKADVVAILDEIKADITYHSSRYNLAKEQGGVGQVVWSENLYKEADIMSVLDKKISELEKTE